MTSFSSLKPFKYVNLTTFRKNGERKTTPIWFAPDASGNVYLWSNLDTWKVKRLRNNPSCELTPCNMSGKKTLGATVDGTARFLNGGDEGRAIAAFKAKYGLMYTVGAFFGSRRPGNEHVYIEIAPRS
ncbi:MAG: PPOX class F420-dependent oxidoreductase [Polyangiales bacterium]